MTKKIVSSVLVVLLATVLFVFMAACGGTEETEGNQGTEAKIVSLEIVRAPRTTVYAEGDEFDPSGMVLRATYDDGTKKSVAAQQCEISPSGALAAGTEKVIVSYEGKSVEVPITMASLGGIVMTSGGMEDSRYPTFGTIDFTDIVSVTAQYTDASGEVVDEKPVDGFSLLFDYIPDGGGEDIADIVADDISAVSGIPAGTYNVHAKLGEFKSAESFPITFFSGFIAEAEEIYDSPTVIGAPEGYNVNAKPEDVMNYTRIEDVTGKNWEQPITGTFRGQSYSNAPAYQIGAANCIRPSDGTTLENSSNGMYLGELSRITTFSVHFYSDVEREVNIIMHAASAMVTGSVVADIKINKMFDIYIGQDAMNADGTFDQSTKLVMDESVVLDGGDYTDTGMNLDQMTTAWKSVNLGRMQLKEGDNVIYFNNIFDSSDPEFSSVKNKWMMNIDCFEVEFV